MAQIHPAPERIKPLTVLYLGRFQPFHNGHLAVVKYLCEFGNKIVIALGSPSPPVRSFHDPFSYRERTEMLVSALSDAEIDVEGVFAVPDINDSKRWVDYVLAIVPHVDLVFSTSDGDRMLWAKKERTNGRFHKYPELLERKFFEREKYEGTQIRNMLADGDEKWRELVPPAVAGFLDKHEAGKLLSSLRVSSQKL